MVITQYSGFKGAWAGLAFVTKHCLMVYEAVPMYKGFLGRDYEAVRE